MGKPRVTLNSAGILAKLQSAQMQAEIAAATEAVAANVRAMNIRVGDRDGGPHEADLPVKTEVVVTDRAHGRVTIAHPAGQAVQAKHGALTKAAAQAGLEVRAK